MNQIETDASYNNQLVFENNMSLLVGSLDIVISWVILLDNWFLTICCISWYLLAYFGCLDLVKLTNTLPMI